MYVFLVSKEETLEPDAEQKATLEGTAFSIWYSKQKDEYTIDREPGVTGSPTS